jgi:exonuclease III
VTRGESGHQHLFKGVAIILSPLFYAAWKAAKSPPPITTEDDFAGCLLKLNVKFDSSDTKGQCIKGKLTSMALISVYFPCEDQRRKQFCMLLDSILSTINPNTQIVMGGDINARIGVRTCNEQKEILGPYNIARSNAQGENLLQVIAAHTLRVENTFFHHRHNKYATYTSLPTTHHPYGIPSMHNIFACSTSLHKQVHDCQMVLHGVASDHQAV